MPYLSKLSQYASQGKIPAEFVELLHPFYFVYSEAALSNEVPQTVFEPILTTFLDLVAAQLASPYPFEIYHELVRAPIDYYKFGVDFIRPLVISERSKVLDLSRFAEIEKLIEKGDNVIFLANHQTELDPQAISLLLENSHSKLGENMIFVAGHRVVQDPMAAPFSMGRNLLCIYSKKYVEDDPAQKETKLMRNQSTMMRMSQLLSEGGKCIYVAPSGGRDRPDRHGHVDVAHFDPQSIEMFWLMAQRAAHPTHFFPLSLSTYHLLPPPDNVKKKLGEARHTRATPIFMGVGQEVDMDHFPGSANLDKKQKRKLRAQYIWDQVRADYQKM